MNRYNIKIKEIKFENDSVIILSNNDIKFISKISKGSINFKIYNSLDEEVNFGCVNEGDQVKIFGKKDDNLNSIEIKKVIITSKYKFNSDSDDSEDFIN